MFDTCVNLHSEQFSSNPWAVIERGFEAGLTGMALTGSCLESSRLAITLANKEPNASVRRLVFILILQDIGTKRYLKLLKNLVRIQAFERLANVDWIIFGTSQLQKNNGPVLSPSYNSHKRLTNLCFFTNGMPLRSSLPSWIHMLRKYQHWCTVLRTGLQN